MTSEPDLSPLNRFVGHWRTEATHPASPGLVVHGTVEVQWLEGERFLIHRSRTDHPDFPDAISIIGYTERDRVDDGSGMAPAAAGKAQLNMHYFDSRGVFRVYDVSVEQPAWRFWRNAPGFSQRFTCTFEDGGNTIVGRWQLSKDDVSWHDDLAISYRRQA